MKRIALLSLLIIPLSFAAKRAQAPQTIQYTGPVIFADTVEGQSAYWHSDVLVHGESQLDGNVYCAQTVTVGADQSADVSAALDVQSVTAGFGNASMTQAQRLAIPNPRNGLQVYQTNGVTGLYLRDAGVWRRLQMF